MTDPHEDAGRHLAAVLRAADPPAGDPVQRWRALQDRGVRSRSVRRRRAVGALAAAAAAVAAVALVLGPDPLGSVVEQADPAPGPLPTCGAAPVTGARYRGVVDVEVVAPPSAPGGSSLEATVRLTSTTGGAVDLTTGLPVLLVVRDGEVVHRPDASSDVGQVWRLSAAPVAHATAVSLVGCPEPQTGAVGRAPDPLPAGDYQLLAVLEAVGPGGSIERLVSAPAPLRIEG